MMDPLIDKLNILSVGLLMVLLPALYHFPLWYFLFLLVRELAVLAGGLWIVRKRKVVLESNRPGKLSSFFTGVCVLCFILDLGTAGWVMLWIALGLALVSTWIYAAAFARAVKGRIPRTIRSE
jgi:phosphatidylglycerophosphate synthase